MAGNSTVIDLFANIKGSNSTKNSLIPKKNVLI